MMKRSFLITLFLLFVVLTGISAHAAGKKPVKWSETVKTVNIDTQFTLILKNNTDRVTWTSSNPDILRLIKKTRTAARVKAIGKGAARITVQRKSDGKKFSCRVTVKDPIRITGSGIIDRGDSGFFEVTGTKKAVRWESDHPELVTLRRISDTKLKVTAVGSGDFYLKARVSGRVYQKKIQIKKRTGTLRIAVAKGVSAEDYLAASGVRWFGAEANLVYDCDVTDYDGLVLPGGRDVNPALYGEQRNGSQYPNEALDGWQWNLLRKFVAANKPVFGICRGLQLINVYFGGSLKQNITGHLSGYHTITIEKGTWMYSLYGGAWSVNTSHHQAVKQPGKDIRILAKAPDGNVEAIEHTSLPVFGVQFHPEIMGGQAGMVILHFLHLCERYR